MATLLKWEDRGVRSIMHAQCFVNAAWEMKAEQAYGFETFDRRWYARTMRKLERAVRNRLANDTDPFPQLDD